MGRPWWYDSYWEKRGKKSRRTFRLPGGKVLTWLVLLALVALIAWWRSFR